ncbi:hypothetical protein GXP67_01295 [Rhodocytophaga rosea]|uniref:DUF3883 domain-containing protein n=1 Tax=Rhodocytophaga rosea TaxID=2704465 RepID=A0A6C0GBT0_9BACT|nr:hypothetical protein [Rhodocytophaga rosea]QHT65405.1 hypothetical protein GXP67_01295 [Rhodocytophaga rosea]
MLISSKTIVEALFQKHHTYYRGIGIETIKQQAGQVEQVSADYQGRVIFELLQNAFDKAEQSILVTVKDNNLFIANDGVAFTYQSNYDYVNGTSQRADFQSLCSISTSTKDANISIGNKGVGFKSVFSIAAHGYADIHTQGKVIQGNRQDITMPISFRIYDSFKNLAGLPEQLPEELKEGLIKQIKQLQCERKERGVPGYYYPVLLQEQEEYIHYLFSQGFVTIIQIPFAENTAREIAGLFEEIKNIHFQFVQLRIPKEINISFDFEEKPELCFQQTINTSIDHSSIVSCPLKEEIKKLAKAANINIYNPQVAIHLKNTEQQLEEGSEGLLYNYLPTKVKSPFRYVDFHADFHTTVDRKSINFEGKVGEYNRALLKGCLELYFAYLNSYIDEASRVKFDNFYWVEVSEVYQRPLEDFNWQYLDTIQATDIIYHTVRAILNIWDNNYKTASKFISSIAKKYFNQTEFLDSNDYNQFYEKCISFIYTYSRNYGGLWEWPRNFKLQLAEQLKMLDARIIPSEAGNSCSINDEIIYREQKLDRSQSFIPSFLAINITSYKIEDEGFRKALGIKEFTDRNEVLKYYRQVSPSGKFHGPENQLTETQQKDLLRSISTLMGKTDENIASTHRYNGFINRNNIDNTPANLADFSISTIFLKTKTGKYKPAQLCNSYELDQGFLPRMPENIKLNTFLKYLGVSYHNNYYFVDKPIWDVLQDGLDYIPALWQEEKTQESHLRHTKILEDIHIISHGKPVHPALINDNDYPFLVRLKIQEFSEEAQPLLIKRYEVFPKEYLSLLIAACKKSLKCKEHLIRFYQNIFEPLHQHLKEYLIIKNGELSFTASTNFYVVNNQQDFRLVENLDILVLCYYKSKLEIESYQFEGKLLELEEGEIIAHSNVDITDIFQKDILPKVFYILTEISLSKLSDTDFFESPERITQLSKKLSNFKFYEADSLRREINIGAIKKFSENRLYDFTEDALVVCKSISSNIRAQAIAKSIFNNSSIAKTIELILFHKNEKDLKNEYLDQIEAWEHIFKRHWITNYEEKFTIFSQRILHQFDCEDFLSDHLWFRYNSTHQSECITKIYTANKLHTLQAAISTEKQHFEDGIFSDFDLEIDYDMYNDQLARLDLILRSYKGATADGLKAKLKDLTGKIGIEDKLKGLENEIRNMFPDAFSANISSDTIKSISKEITIQSKVERIYQNISKSSTKSIASFETGQNIVVNSIPVKTKKVIYQGKELPSNEFEAIGTYGEEEVVSFLIKYFLQIKNTEFRKEALYEVNNLILTQLRKDDETHQKHTELYKACLKYISDDTELAKALIPFYYITLHYQYAFIDIVAWFENKAVLVEVKSTQNQENPSFKISNSEVNEAMEHENYMIVRVTPNKIIFLGNPIYEIKEKLTRIEGSNFTIQPHGYTFTFRD